MAKLIKKIMRPGISPQLLIHLMEASLFLLLVIAIANLIWSLVSPGNSIGLSMTGNNNPTIPERQGGNRLNANQPSTALKELFGKTAVPDSVSEYISGPVAETKLNLRLRGILADRASDRKFALIAKDGEDEKIYRIGEEVADAEIIHIGFRRVIIRRNGINESLSLKTKEVQMNSGDGGELSSNNNGSGDAGMLNDKKQRRVSKAVLDHHLNNLPQLLKQAKAVPYTNNGRQTGFRVVEIDNGSFFNDLGLKRNDVITAVNGISIRNTKEAMHAYQVLKTAQAFQVDILRGNREVTIAYSLQ